MLQITYIIQTFVIKVPDEPKHVNTLLCSTEVLCLMVYFVFQTQSIQHDECEYKRSKLMLPTLHRLAGVSDLHVNVVLPPTCSPLTVDVTNTVHLRFAMQHCHKSQKTHQY